jgi:hypothetical protein
VIAKYGSCFWNYVLKNIKELKKTIVELTTEDINQHDESLIE